MGHIGEMYYQVQTPEEQRSFLRLHSRDVSRVLLGTPFFGMVIFSCGYYGCQWVKKFGVLKTSDPLKNIFLGVKYLKLLPYITHYLNLYHEEFH